MTGRKNDLSVVDTPEFVAGAIYALALLAQLHGSDVEIRDVLRSIDTLPAPMAPDSGGNYGSPWTRDELVAAGADVYDSEQVVACLEGREPEGV